MIPTEIADLTPDWFTGILRGAKTIREATAVTAVTAEPIGTGQVGFVLRAELTYDGEPGPPSLVVKVPSRDAGSRQMAMAMGLYEAEIRFYEEIAPRLGATVLTAHHADYDPDGRFILVLDDLTGSAEVGDMVSGCDADRAAVAITALPAIQARLWDDPRLPSRPWLDPTRTDMLFGAVEPALEVFLERFGGRLPSEHLALARELAPKAAPYRSRVWRPPYVIAHSDYRLDNMLFGTSPNSPPISIVDWHGARLGPPLLDVAVFMAGCVDSEQRAAMEQDLLREYHETLRVAGITGFGFDDCLDSYRRCSLWPFLLGIAVSVAIEQTERGDAMWSRLIAGAAEIVLDTRAAELLD